MARTEKRNTDVRGNLFITRDTLEMLKHRFERLGSDEQCIKIIAATPWSFPHRPQSERADRRQVSDRGVKPRRPQRVQCRLLELPWILAMRPPSPSYGQLRGSRYEHRGALPADRSTVKNQTPA